MKRKEFIYELEKSGCVLHRHGARHDHLYQPDNWTKVARTAPYRSQGQFMPFNSETAWLIVKVVEGVVVYK